MEAGGPTGIGGSKEQGGTIKREREREKVERVNYGRGKEKIFC